MAREAWTISLAELKEDLGMVADIESPPDIEGSSRLIEDLGIDSLGMMELM